MADPIQSTLVTTGNTFDPTAATPTGRRLSFLDAARGVAAVAVCVQHLFELSFRAFGYVGHYWLNLGIFGVTTFFLISGFIIPATLEKYASFGRFWLGRLLRLYPMYLCALLIVMCLAWASGTPSPFAACPHPAVCLVGDLTMLQDFARIPAFFGASWTLGLEMVFYILCSFVWWFGWRRYPVRLAVAAIAVTAALATAGLLLHRPLPAGRIGLLATCFFGSMVYHVYRGRIRGTALWLVLPLALALAEGFYLRFVLYPEKQAGGDTFFSFACVCISWGAAYAFFFALYAIRDRSFPDWLLWLGKVSYSFYILADILPTHLPGQTHHWFWIVESMVVCLALSACTYRWIERPAMLLLRKQSPGLQGSSR